MITQGDGHRDGPDPDWVTTFKVSAFSNSTSDEEVFVKDEDGNVKLSASISSSVFFLILGGKSIMSLRQNETP